MGKYQIQERKAILDYVIVSKIVEQSVERITIDEKRLRIIRQL